MRKIGKWLLHSAIFLLGGAVAVGLAFLVTHERVAFNWEAEQVPGAHYYLVYYGQESRHPWWDGFEDYFYLQEGGQRLTRRLKETLERAEVGEVSRQELDSFRDKVGSLLKTEEQLYRKLLPYPNVKRVSGSSHRAVMWFRRNTVHFVSFRAFDAEDRGTPFFAERMYAPDGTVHRSAEKGFWI